MHHREFRPGGPVGGMCLPHNDVGCCCSGCLLRFSPQIPSHGRRHSAADSNEKKRGRGIILKPSSNRNPTIFTNDQNERIAAECILAIGASPILLKFPYRK